MRKINFSVGPSVLPECVLSEIKDNLFDWNSSGLGVLEVGCRDSSVLNMIEDTKQLLRDVMAIPPSHEILFMQGGGIAMNSAIPMNLMAPNYKANFIITGVWSKKSFEEASKYGIVRDDLFCDGSSYIHICDNETVDGVEFQTTKDYGVPLVADFSSSILTKQVDVSKYGVIFACAQKNLGIAGLTVVIIRKDLIGNAIKETPSVFDFETVSQYNSSYNTPPVFAIYVAGLMLKWIKNLGGIKVVEHQNFVKSQTLYSFIDSSTLYKTRVTENRSRINIPFHIKDSSYDRFNNLAEAEGMFGLMGSKYIESNIRANLYNSVSLKDVNTLVDFMEFYEKHYD